MKSLVENRGRWDAGFRSPFSGLFYTKSSGKTGLPASDGWGAVSEIVVKTRLLGLQAP